MPFANAEVFNMIKASIETTLQLTEKAVGKHGMSYTEGLCDGLRSALQSIEVAEHYVTQQTQKEEKNEGHSN